ncbi:uncharacterized protein LOC143299997 [Babylonia areolata]|uniref:uncharacterized protein LOC143299997 n=1 Tax=Babylonia areolata TaxID=304850 RepID=UPI003FD36614
MSAHTCYHHHYPLSADNLRASNTDVGDVTIKTSSRSDDGSDVSSLSVKLRSKEAVSQYIVSLEGRNASASRLGFTDYFTVQLASPSAEQVWLNLTCGCRKDSLMAVVDVTMTALKDPAHPLSLYSVHTYPSATQKVPDIVRVAYRPGCKPTENAHFVLEPSASVLIAKWGVVTNLSQPLCQVCSASDDGSIPLPQKEVTCQVYFLYIVYTPLMSADKTQTVYYVFPTTHDNGCPPHSPAGDWHSTSPPSPPPSSSSFASLPAATQGQNVCQSAASFSPTRIAASSSSSSSSSLLPLRTTQPTHVPTTPSLSSTSSLLPTTTSGADEHPESYPSQHLISVPKSSTPSQPSSRLSTAEEFPPSTRTEPSSADTQTTDVSTGTDITTSIFRGTSSQSRSSSSPATPGYSSSSDSRKSVYSDSSSHIEWQLIIYVVVGVGVVMVVVVLVVVVLCYQKRPQQHCKQQHWHGTGDGICSSGGHDPGTGMVHTKATKSPRHRQSIRLQNVDEHSLHLTSHNNYSNVPDLCPSCCRHPSTTTSSSQEGCCCSSSSRTMQCTVDINSCRPLSPERNSDSTTCASSPTPWYRLALVYCADDLCPKGRCANDPCPRGHVTRLRRWLRLQFGELVKVSDVVIPDAEGLRRFRSWCQEEEGGVRVLILLSREVREILCGRSRYCELWESFIRSEIGRCATSYMAVRFVQNHSVTMPDVDGKFFSTIFSAERMFEVSDWRCEELGRLLEELVPEEHRVLFHPPSLVSGSEEGSADILVGLQRINAKNEDWCASDLFHQPSLISSDVSSDGVQVGFQKINTKNKDCHSSTSFEVHL